MPTSRAVRRIAQLITGTLVGASLLSAAGAATAQADTTFVPASDGAKITDAAWTGNSVDLTVTSPALAQTVKVRVLVPKGWTADAKRTWPVLYAYHGGRDNYVSWTRSTDIAKLAADYGVLVVMPESGWEGAFANYYNNGKGGTPEWEKFHTEEVIQLIARNFHAGTARAAMGISSGATGSIRYAARHKGLFKYAASFSGILHTTAPGVQAISMSMLSVLGDGTDPFLIWGIPGLHDKNWKALDPYYLAPKLKGVKVYVSSGTTGKPGRFDKDADLVQKFGGYTQGGPSERMTGATSKDFVARMKALKIPVTTHIYGNGWHQWLYWQYEMHTTWPTMMKTIGAKKVA